jgi:hypothetical protein
MPHGIYNGWLHLLLPMLHRYAIYWPLFEDNAVRHVTTTRTKQLHFCCAMVELSGICVLMHIIS